MKTSNIPRIKDIATLAGVSVGTVDRVLHGRGEVSEENRIKIEKIIEETDYQPNMVARFLALKQSFHLVAVLPAFHPGEYWERPFSGMEQALRELSVFRITLERFTFSQFNPESFELAMQSALAVHPDGLVLTPMFPLAAASFSAQLSEQKIPYITSVRPKRLS